ncbi:MarR family winged helix-turn-helix transcriptional regulator [Lactobacillaceae bacterium Scapto_B20]
MNPDQKLSTIFFAYQRFASMVDLTKYNLTKNQHRIIFIVSSLDNVSVKKILLLLNISKQAVNVAIRDLMERGLVEEQRSNQDKRVKFLSLTDAGTTLNQQICDEQLQLLDQYFESADGDWQQAMQNLAQGYLDRIKLD